MNFGDTMRQALVSLLVLVSLPVIVGALVSAFVLVWVVSLPALVWVSVSAVLLVWVWVLAVVSVLDRDWILALAVVLVIAWEWAWVWAFL